jgi:hypothetical protein
MLFRIRVNAVILNNTSLSCLIKRVQFPDERATLLVVAEVLQCTDMDLPSSNTLSLSKGRPSRTLPVADGSRLACGRSCTWGLAINIFAMDLDVAYALGAAALFGASTPAAKLLLRNVSTMMLAALLYLGAAFALTVYRFIVMSKSREAQLTRGDIRLIIGIIFFGWMLGPVLMLMGLRNLSALAGSLLLNHEAPCTVLIAIGLLREHLGGREALAAVAVMTGALLISVQPGYFGVSWRGAVEIAAACLSWGIDNNLT